MKASTYWHRRLGSSAPVPLWWRNKPPRPLENSWPASWRRWRQGLSCWVQRSDKTRKKKKIRKFKFILHKKTNFMEFSLKHTRKLIGTSLFQSKKKKREQRLLFWSLAAAYQAQTRQILDPISLLLLLCMNNHFSSLAGCQLPPVIFSNSSFHATFDMELIRLAAAPLCTSNNYSSLKLSLI